jgi:hypothetical protein
VNLEPGCLPVRDPSVVAAHVGEAVIDEKVVERDARVARDVRAVNDDLVVLP